MSSDLDTLHKLSEHSASPVLLTSIGPHGAEYSLYSPCSIKNENSKGSLSDSQFEKRPSQASRPKILPYIALPGITTLGQAPAILRETSEETSY